MPFIILVRFLSYFSDPDITGGDGVYSRYMPYLSNMHLESGLYDLRIYVNNYQGLAEFPVMQREETINNDNIKQFCCSNTIEYPNLSPLPDFMRSYLHGAIELQYNTIIEDLVPPTRILDLRAQVYSEKDKAIIRWTSPGNDYDWGRAYLYEAVLAETWIKAKAFIGERIVSMPMPESVGTDQSVTVHMEQYGEIVFIAIRAVDEAGNRGGVSNIAILSMVEPVSTTVATSTSPQPMEPASSMIEPLGYGIKPPVPQPTSDYIVETTAIVIGSVTGVLTITAAVTIFCFLHVFGRRNHRQLQSDDKNDSNQSILKETDSPHEQADGETHELLSSKTISCINILAKDQCTLSPISAWNNPGCVDEPIKDSVLVHNPQLECKEIKEKSQNPADVFPDVTNTQSCSFLSSQIPFSMPVNFSSYQAGCTSGVYTSYPYSYSTLPCCAHERIMPISSAGPSSYPCHAGGSANSLPQSGLSCSTENVHSCSLENLQGQSMLDQSPSLCIGYAQSTIHSQPEQINMVECRNVPISSCTQAQHVNKPSLLPKPPYSPKLTRVQKLKQEELPKVITSSTSVPKEPVHRNVTQV
ncbi:unnamed protein product [Meganyctiphanes norvegica]|uniref:Fibronectin type-III domain-containing protein n=1 Tax=Meganyctiphanes norvegica TaxID=48144 RepID=A0AAV2Q3I7_MEGNR